MQLFPVPESKSGPQIIEMLTKRVTALGGILSGSFMVDCETYTSVTSLGKLIHKSITSESESVQQTICWILLSVSNIPTEASQNNER